MSQFRPSLSVMAALILAAAFATRVSTLAMANDGGAASPPYSIFTGKVTAIDVTGGSITFTNKTGASKTFTVNADTKVMGPNQAPQSFGNIKIGWYGGAKSSDDKTAIAVLAAPPGIDSPAKPGAGNPPTKPGGQYYTGMVSAIDTAAGSITITNHDKVATTFSVTGSTEVYGANKSVIKFSDIQVGWEAMVRSSDGKTALVLMSRAPQAARQ